MTLEPVGKWSKVGLQIFESNVPLGATPEYLAGHYILQARLVPAPRHGPGPTGERTDPRHGRRPPGGKTTHAAALMRNTGVIFANDPSKTRAKGLIGNVHRLGASNVVVCNYDAREFPRVMGGFDRVLLDAPCSGTGVISKDPSVKVNRTEKDFMQLPHTQKAAPARRHRLGKPREQDGRRNRLLYVVCPLPPLTPMPVLSLVTDRRFLPITAL